MTAPSPRERHYTSEDNLRLFFRDFGDPDWPFLPVLCLPGLTRNSKDFDRLAGWLADPSRSAPRRVIAPDLRGRGRSAYDPNWRNYMGRVYLNDLRHLLASTGIARVIVVGVSMGGLLGMAMATALPTVLAGLVINDIGPEVDHAGQSRILAYISRDHPQPDWPSAAKHLRQRLPNLSIRTEEEWLSFAQATFRKGEDGVLHFDWDLALANPLRTNAEAGVDLWALWRAARTTPALVIRGGLSDILSEATLDRMRADRPDLAHVTLPGVGHAPTLNEPPIREVLDEFLRQF